VVGAPDGMVHPLTGKELAAEYGTAEAGSPTTGHKAWVVAVVVLDGPLYLQVMFFPVGNWSAKLLPPLPLDAVLTITWFQPAFNGAVTVLLAAVPFCQVSIIAFPPTQTLSPPRTR